MYRGTTPTVEFVSPVDRDTIDALYLSIAQEGKVLVEKTLNDCEWVGHAVKCKLTQLDTLALDASKYANFQVLIKTTSGDALASDITPVHVGLILKDGEI